MVVYSFYIFDRHTECIYKRRWLPRQTSVHSKTSRPASDSVALSNGISKSAPKGHLSAEDDAKLIFGTVFSLRNMVRKLGGDDDK
ncbi:Trafficking protein particle complex subunit BET5 [Emydomyces testavorans]|uniref:Trafficking protein particle complex subunit BET5 n=1 Tax=Emydomyces testavorans TaxID=2070801 RepID=A0AAF0DDW6_9EURO|nr:Trafficking protein particle complex subunit BET5 [Emydomyces testavorans]